MSDDLAAMGVARVKRLNVQGRTVIHKTPLNRTETYFYRYLANHPQYQGPPTPEVAAWRGEGALFEYIPHPIGARETLSRDLLEPLARLHQNTIRVDSQQLFTFPWTPAEGERALQHFPKEQRGSIRQRLKPWYDEVDVLLEPQCLVSGDTNHGNWGRRASGEAVLFDWERLAQATPAIDLAPLIPGLANEAVVGNYVRLYRSAWPGCPWSEGSLVRQVMQTMALVAMEVVNILHDRQNAEVVRYQSWFNEHYLPWLGSISSSRRSLRSHN
ncbi:phosphotransferase family protein [Saccharospirillum mangrovi]|uniref:phosphotransferase family protein n=1 Tax=Saccharospirillum mangrovi TaxID=2161747 RepID=UPI000D368041|nr:phosphotransferase [Saccharospirillum mangrovi]